MIETKFKQTEFGDIPEGWQESNLSFVLKDFTTGATPYRGIKDFYSGYIPWVSSGELNFNLIKDTNEHITEAARQKTNLKLYPAGTFLMAITGLEAEGTRGKCAILGTPATTNQSCLALSSTDKMIVEYWFYFYQYWSDWYAFRFSQGTKQQSYKADIVRKFPIIFPSNIKEQQRIADALSNIDQLISSLSKTLEKKRLIKQGAMQQLLTGKKRLPGFDGEWETHRIGDFLSILKGYGLSKSHLVQDGVNKCILYGELFTKYDYEIKTCISRTNSEEGLPSESGDILLPGSTTTNGIDLAKAVSVYENSIHLGGDIVVLRDKKIVEYEPYFVSAIITELCKQAIEQSSQGITIIHLNTRELRKIEVAIPSTHKEQMAIVTVLRTMDNEIESLEEEREKYIRLKEGMMQKLLSGQIRLINTEAKPIVQPKEKVANVYFRRSVLAAEITDRLCEERTFGHVKMEKLIFLTEHLCHVDIDSHYHRDAAGPYDNRALRSIDSQMKKQKWFEAKKEDKGYRYLPLQNRGGHKKYFEKYYADVMPMFEKIIDTFKTSSTEQCEIVATLYSAWDDLLHSRQSFTDDEILNEVLNNWNETKKRIKRSRWQAALDWMRANGFVPQNDNR